jgi:ribosomal protein L24E
MNYRNTSVSPSGSVPVLLQCGLHKADGTASFKAGFAGLVPVRVVGDAAVDLFAENGPAFQAEYGSIPDKQSVRLLGLLQLAGALKSGDEVEKKAAYNRLATDPEPLVRELHLEELKKYPHRVLARDVSAGTRKVQFVLWYTRENEMVPGLYCEDSISALYALVLARIAGGRGLGACLNCGTVLRRKRKTRKFCSNKCRQEMYRLKRAPRRGKPTRSNPKRQSKTRRMR